MKVFSINPLFLANDSVRLGQDDGEQEEEQPKMLAKEDKCKGCGNSFDTVQKLATHSIYCPDVQALREGQQTLTGIN